MGLPIQAGRSTVTAEAVSFVIRWPRGGFVWNYPVAVHVRHDGGVQRYPLVDVTRVVQLSLWLAVALVWIGVAVAALQGKEKADE